MHTITAKHYVTAAQKLAEEAQQRTIPYTIGGAALSGMDCQGLCEYLLTECGIPKRSCNLSGSNAHWRACRFQGSIRECIQTYGRVPEGAWLFICSEDDSTAPDKYRGDGMGNASHMGVVLPGKKVLHASFSRGRVIVSDFQTKAVRGGFNKVGLPKWIDYGDQQQAMQTVDVSGFYTVKRGCIGGAVRRLQNRLLSLSYSVGRHGADGRFGRDTENAVLCFQKDHGLVIDGIVGQKTWRALFDMQANQTSERDETHDMG